MVTISGVLRGWRDSLKASFRLSICDKIDTKDAYILYGGSSFPSGVWFAKKLLSHPIGEKMLLGNSEMTRSALSNREYLTSLPEGTLGREYAEAITGMYSDEYEMSFTGDDDVRLLPGFGLQKDRKWTDLDSRNQKIADRMFGEIRWQHDLMHVLLGYDPDMAGEIGATAFSVRHVLLPGPLIVTMMWIIVRPLFNKGFRDSLIAIEGLINGFKTKKWLFPTDWSEHLSRPIDEVREEFGIILPKAYRRPHC